MDTRNVIFTYDDYLTLPDNGKKHEKYGVKEYWIVDPERNKLEVFHLEKGAYRRIGSFSEDTTIKSRIIPEFDVYV